MPMSTRSTSCAACSSRPRWRRSPCRSPIPRSCPGSPPRCRMPRPPTAGTTPDRFIEANARFHAAWHDLVANRRLLRALALYAGHVRYLRVLTLNNAAARKAALAGMKNILTALRKRDGERARARDARSSARRPTVPARRCSTTSSARRPPTARPPPAHGRSSVPACASRTLIMPLRAEIPYGAYWSTPFARWQGSLAHLHSVEFAAQVVARELARRGIAPERIDFGVLGLSVPQKHAFYGMPWLAGMSGAPQRCRPDHHAGLRDRRARAARDRAGDRGRHGRGRARRHLRPHVERPAPLLPESDGTGRHRCRTRIGCCPTSSPIRWARTRCCTRPRTWRRKHGFTTAAQHAIVLRREEQYRMALADGFGVPQAIHDAAVRGADREFPQDPDDAGRRRRHQLFDRRKVSPG